MFTQGRSRLIAGVAIAGCAAMAWYGERALIGRDASVPYLAVYWGLFVLLFVVAMYMVFLDLRFIRLHYAAGQREIFRSTLGSEDFRRAINAAAPNGNEPGQEDA